MACLLIEVAPAHSRPRQPFNKPIYELLRTQDMNDIQELKDRRDQLLIEAGLLHVELLPLEARQKHKEIERRALFLSKTVLEEKWNEAAKTLFEVGGKLWANYNLLGIDQVGLMKLAVPEEGENFGNWTWEELSVRSRQYTAYDLLHLNKQPIAEQPEEINDLEKSEVVRNDQTTTEQRDLV